MNKRVKALLWILRVTPQEYKRTKQLARANKKVLKKIHGQCLHK